MMKSSAPAKGFDEVLGGRRAGMANRAGASANRYSGFSRNLDGPNRDSHPLRNPPSRLISTEIDTRTDRDRRERLQDHLRLRRNTVVLSVVYKPLWSSSRILLLTLEKENTSASGKLASFRSPCYY